MDAHENNGVVQIEVFVFVDGDALGAEGEEAPGALAEVSNELAGVIGTGCLDHSEFPILINNVRRFKLNPSRRYPHSYK